jgi:putative transposase
MANHIHVMMTPGTVRAISRTMKQVGERYSRYFNRRYDRIGTPWSGRFRSLLITDERYWLTCMRYVEQNPVRAGMVVDPSDYPWSSYSAHALGHDHSWLQSHPVFDRLGRSSVERAETYRSLCSAAVRWDDVRKLRTPPRTEAPVSDASGEGGSDPGD